MTLPASPSLPDHDTRRAPLGMAQAAVMLALLLGLQPVMTDLYLPSLPAIAGEFNAPLSATQLTMSVLILAFGPMQLVWGPASDRWGRRPVLLTSLTLMAVASLGAAASTSIGMLVAWRAAQGAALAAGVMCARAIVRDLYQPSEGARVMSLALSGLGLVAVAAPLGGGLIAAAWGWRAALAAVTAIAIGALVAIAWRLPETLRTPNPQGLQVRVLARNARVVLSHPTFHAWTLLVAATYAGLFVLLSGTSFAYARQLGMSPAQVGLALACGSLVYIAGTFLCRRWLRLHGMTGTVKRGVAFSLTGGLGLGACGLLDAPPAAAVLLTHWVYLFGHGVVQPCGQAGSVGPFPQMAGMASALAGCILALTAFATGTWLGHAMDGTVRPLGIGLASAAVATALVAWTLVQRHGEPPRASAT